MKEIPTKSVKCFTHQKTSPQLSSQVWKWEVTDKRLFTLKMGRVHRIWVANWIDFIRTTALFLKKMIRIKLNKVLLKNVLPMNRAKWNDSHKSFRSIISRRREKTVISLEMQTKQLILKIFRNARKKSFPTMNLKVIYWISSKMDLMTWSITSLTLPRIRKEWFGQWANN